MRYLVKPLALQYKPHIFDVIRIRTTVNIFWSAFFVSILLSYLFSQLLFPFLKRFNILDIPNHRSVHKKPVYKMGGVIFISGYLCGILYLILFHSCEFPTQITEKVIPIFLGALCIAVIGAIDDLKNLSSVTKFLLECALAAILCQFGITIPELSFLGLEITLGVWEIPFTVFWIVGILNAVNLMDGLDGLAGGISFITLSTLILLNYQDPIATLMLPGLLGGLLVFLCYNFNPASVFMGDVGSLFLGYHMAVFSITVVSFKTATLGMMAPVFLLGVPVLDTFMAIFRRLRNGKFIFQADKMHLHHQLLSLGVSHRTVVIVLYMVSVTLSAIVHFSIEYGKTPSGPLLFGCGLLITFFLYGLSTLQKIFANGRIAGEKSGIQRCISLYLKAHHMPESEQICNKKIQELELKDLEAILLQIFYERDQNSIRNFIANLKTGDPGKES